MDDEDRDEMSAAIRKVIRENSPEEAAEYIDRAFDAAYYNGIERGRERGYIACRRAILHGKWPSRDN